MLTGKEARKRKGYKGMESRRRNKKTGVNVSNPLS